MADILYTIIVLFKNMEGTRKAKNQAKYKQQYWEMEHIWRNNTTKLSKWEPLRTHITNTYHNFMQDINYKPPVFKIDNIPAQSMKPTHIPSATLSNSNISLVRHNTVHVPKLPPIQQYNNIGGPLSNTKIYKQLNESHKQLFQNLEQSRQIRENTFRQDMNRMNKFY